MLTSKQRFVASNRAAFRRSIADRLAGLGIASDAQARKVSAQIGRIVRKFNDRQDTLDARGDGSRLAHSRAHRASMARVDAVREGILSTCDLGLTCLLSA